MESQSDKIDQLMLAIKNIQQKADPIKKNATGQVGSRQYKYNNLNDTWETIKVLVDDNDLVVYQSPFYSNSGGTMFKTTLYHTASGQFITEVMPMILTKQDPQGIGAAITYYRRYMLISMLGLIPDDDNDAREQRLATAEQKLQIIGAVKLAFPDVKHTPEYINTTLENIVGKHPAKIREDEVKNVIDLVKAYKETTNE